MLLSRHQCTNKKHATDFGGMLRDKEVMMLYKVSRNSYYKYKRERKLTN